MTAPVEPTVSAGGRIIALPVIAYRTWIRPLRASGGATCRFEPSCSAYAVEALHVWGPVRGLWLALRRLGRCHPWGGVGVDPVPVRVHRPQSSVATPSIRRSTARSSG